MQAVISHEAMELVVSAVQAIVYEKKYPGIQLAPITWTLTSNQKICNLPPPKHHTHTHNLYIQGKVFMATSLRMRTSS